MSDPDLCARVARAMGGEHTPCHCGFYKWNRHHRCDRPGPATWRPAADADPADAWRVLEFALNHPTLRNTVLNALRELTTEVPHGATVDGHAIRFAILNAVAALGGEE